MPTDTPHTPGLSYKPIIWQRLRIIFLGLMLLYPIANWAQPAENGNHRPKIALVLSGGGAKGFAHIGVLKVLEEEGLPIDLIVGTSMGSLVGGIYSIGYSASEIETLVKSLDWENTLTDEVPRAFHSKNDQLLKQRYIFSLPITGHKKLSLPQGLVKGQNVLSIFCDLAGNVPTDADFQKFPIPFACVATNLENGKEVILKNGFLPTAMYSSMAIPIAFQSSVHNGMFLVDGGLVNNFPTDVARKLGADIIIGVDIRNDFFDRKNLQSLDNVVGQLIGFFDQSKDSVNKSLCDIIIRPDVSGYSMTSFTNQAVDTLIFRGEKATAAFREQIRDLKQKFGLSASPVSRDLVKPQIRRITEITFSGNYHLDPDFLKKTLSIDIPGEYTSSEIKTAIDRLVGLGGFERISYTFSEGNNGKILNINLTSREISTQNVGFKANTVDGAAILINTTRKNYKNIFGYLSASAELSVNPELSFTAETNKTNLPTLGLNIKGKYQNYNIFDQGKKAFEANIFHSSASVYFYQPFVRHLELGMGLQEEYFHGDIFSKNTGIETSGKMDQFLSNVYSYLSFDNMDDYYFPTRGTNMYAEFSIMGDFNASTVLSPVALFKMKNVIPLDENISLLFDINGRALFNSDSPLSRMTLVGGEPYTQYFNYHLPFVGLPALTISERYTLISLIGLRMRLSKSQYASVLFNGMWQDTDLLLRKKAKTTFGGGFRYSIKSKLGPLDLTLGYSGEFDRPTFSANFGYWF